VGLSALRHGWKHIEWWQIVLLQALSRLLPERGTPVLEEEWDSLIILDACRFDCFRNLHGLKELPGRLEHRFSLGTETTTFLRRNFRSRRDDIVYVTANPFVNRYLEGKFHRIIPVWKYGWSEEHRTVLPETMYMEALKAHLRYRDKRLIVHFIQPHYPYIGDRVSSRHAGYLRDEMVGKGEGRPFRDVYLDRPFFVYSMPVYGLIEGERQRALYWMNLKRAVHYVLRLIDALPGRTVVTADHGEAFGEPFRSYLPIHVYGHLPNVKMDVLERVPWLVVEPEEKNPERVLRDVARARRAIAEEERKRLRRALSRGLSRGVF